VSESYFQTQRRKELAEVRKRVLEIQQNAIESNSTYLKHEKKYPGRIDHFMSLATSHLDDAERMITAMVGTPTKGWWIAFRKTLEVADHYVRQALWDPDVQRAIEWKAAVKRKRGSRWPELDNDIRAGLERNPNASNKDIWNRLPDSFAGRKYYVDADNGKIVSDSGRELQFGGFSSRVTKIRKDIKNLH